MTEIQRLVQAYQDRGVIVDTDLLLAFLVGNFDRKWVARHKRTNEYSPEDYDDITAILERFRGRILTTCAILTEVNNLLFAKGSPSEHLAAYAESFRSFLKVSTELDEASTKMAAMPHLPEFGLTDLGILACALDRYLVLTDDGPLAGYLRRNSVDVLDLMTIRRIQGRQ